MLLTQTAFAQKQKKFLGFATLYDTLSIEKKDFFVLPLLYYTPDTRWAYRGAGVYYFKVPPKNEDEVLPEFHISSF